MLKFFLIVIALHGPLLTLANNYAGTYKAGVNTFVLNTNKTVTLTIPYNPPHGTQTAVGTWNDSGYITAHITHGYTGTNRKCEYLVTYQLTFADGQRKQVTGAKGFLPQLRDRQPAYSQSCRLGEYRSEYTFENVLAPTNIPDSPALIPPPRARR